MHVGSRMPVVPGVVKPKEEFGENARILIIAFLTHKKQLKAAETMY